MTTIKLDSEAARIRDAQARCAFPIKTHLMPTEIDTLPEAMVLRGVEMGVLKFNDAGAAGGGWSPVDRRCTDCREVLPLLVFNSNVFHSNDVWLFAAFPRCSRHAF
jgi:hypothetical protein